MMKNRHLGILIVLAGVIVIFLDIDCYVIKDISHVFDSDFDIAVVRWTKDPSVQISAGVFFINKNSNKDSYKVIKNYER